MTPRDRAKEVVKEMGETGQITKVAWMLEIEKAIIAAIEESSTIVSEAELERATAIAHLCSIIDGKDRDAAIHCARAWLKEIYSENYGIVSLVSQYAGKVADGVDWPNDMTWLD